MSGFLLDTNVLSETSRKTPDSIVVKWLVAAAKDQLFTSVLALAEIRLGIELLDESKRRSELKRWFEEILLPSFQNRILSVNQSIADRWAIFTAQARRQGRSLLIADGLIAATALEHRLVIVTRNVKDFDELGVEIFNPWEE